MDRYLLLAGTWLLWCVIHSLLVCRPVTDFLETRLPGLARWHRLGFNLTAVLTLVPVLVLSHSLRGDPLFRWEGVWLRLIQFALIAAALWLFAAGARRYDLMQFAGLRQARDGRSCGALTADCRLDTGGVLQLVRHPWYTGALLILWARNLDAAAIVTNLVLTAYLVVGALLEESKLRAQFGHGYAEYQRQVSMLLPVKWFRRRLRRG